MAKIDLFDPKWVDMVFADKNQSYGAYKLRKGTSGRNIKALVILLIAALLIGGFLAWKVIEEQREAERIARMEALELSKLQEQAREKKEQPKIEKQIEPEKVKEVVRETQKFTAPVIKKDELVKEENQLTNQADLKEDVAVGAKDQEGTKDRLTEAIKVEEEVGTPPPPEPKKEVAEKIFEVVEKSPSFKGNINQWLNQNLRYPAAAEENGIEGKVIVQFVVEKDGSVTQIKAVRSPDPSLEKEAIRVVSMMPKWTPGINNGQPVRVKYTLPVSFKLQ
ncbi:MAG: energy transducer TonB [Prevotella sp.]|nr:energy transducer TonB [Prevotella sp.]